MTVRCVVGLQWGDEGKGKVVDVLSEGAAVVVRYQGGANAGHTLEIEGQKFVSHLVPSGIFHPRVLCVVGNGVVIDPEVLLEEIDALRALGVDLEGRLAVSQRAHLVLPYHKARERVDGEMARIGTTGRGIGPTYVDKVGRVGLRVCDLYEPEYLRRAVTRGVEAVHRMANGNAADLGLDIDAIVATYTEYAERLKPYVTDTVSLLHTRMKAGEGIVLEGAQGTLLDIDFGTYPYLTSSNSSVAGVSSGVGLSPRFVDEVVGISKAYATRVGEGPFPSELLDADGERLRKIGSEFGATTGRPRRCGWIDLVALRYALRLNGVDNIALTKLDVLSGFEQIKAATAYEIDGERTDEFPASISRLERVTPIYESLPGWTEDISDVRTEADLPGTTRAYLDYLQQALDTPIRWVSVGPSRAAILERSV